MRALISGLTLWVFACSAQGTGDQLAGASGTTNGGSAGTTARPTGGANATGGANNNSGGTPNGSGGSSNPTGGAPSTGGIENTGGTATTGGTGGSTGGTGGTGGGSTGGTGGTNTGGSGTGGAPTGACRNWQNVTPSGVNLTTDFGAQDVLADPAKPGTFYGFVCLQGVYRSTDWGATWTHVSQDGNLEQGRPWGEAIAPDGSYMLACTGYGPNVGAWRSTDGGATWASHLIGGNNDPYMFDVDASNKNHALSSSHSLDNTYESTDGGLTWKDKGSSGAGGSNYVFFINSTTWLAIGQDGSGTGTRRTTNSGASWSRVGPMEHAHGNAQIYIDPSNGDVYAAGHGSGVYRSTDGGASFNQVSTTRGSSVFATGSRIYSMDPGANGGGTAPTPQSTLRSDGTNWSAFSVPSAMNNGAKRAATTYDAATGHWVIVSGNWNAGFWRCVED